mmetsp:Transcript_6517/g.20861  ORF Transcript_6517/g.20861 Transcript_6517/m.20861 type:complete len:161 (+) Transcript_6517:124-606(+)
MRRLVLVLSALALLERAATFASGPLSCAALDKIVAVDSEDKGPDLQLEEVLATARELRGAGCEMYVATNKALERRFERGDGDGDGNLDPAETKAVIDVLAGAPAAEGLLDCLAGLYEAAGCDPKRRKLSSDVKNVLLLVIDIIASIDTESVDVYSHDLFK